MFHKKNDLKLIRSFFVTFAVIIFNSDLAI